MTRFRTLPLGVDLGRSRVRVALAEADGNGAARLRAVVARELPSDCASSGEVEQPQLVAAVIEEMLDELGVRERRCVGAIGGASAALRVIRFPVMGWGERLRAARFEAQRFASWNLEEEASHVRVHAVDRADERYAVGVVRVRTLNARLGAFKAARLKPVALEHDACVFRRMLPEVDAIVDIGVEQTTLHTFGDSGPHSVVLGSGGDVVTQAIASDLSIDQPTAERRKRILGVAGAGAGARTQYAHDLASLVERARSRTSITRIALVGNGARVPGLANAIEDASGASVDVPVAEIGRASCRERV